jgi:hypothetical protein
VSLLITRKLLKTALLLFLKRIQIDVLLSSKRLMNALQRRYNFAIFYFLINRTKQYV